MDSFPCCFSSSLFFSPFEIDVLQAPFFPNNALSHSWLCCAWLCLSWLRNNFVSNGIAFLSLITAWSRRSSSPVCRKQRKTRAKSRFWENWMKFSSVRDCFFHLLLSRIAFAISPYFIAVFTPNFWSFDGGWQRLRCVWEADDREKYDKNQLPKEKATKRRRRNDIQVSSSRGLTHSMSQKKKECHQRA